MEHLLNCHGEWALALQFAATLPFVGLWARAILLRIRGARQPHEHERH